MEIALLHFVHDGVCAKEIIRVGSRLVDLLL